MSNLLPLQDKRKQKTQETYLEFSNPHQEWNLLWWPESSEYVPHVHYVPSILLGVFTGISY